MTRAALSFASNPTRLGIPGYAWWNDGLVHPLQIDISARRRLECRTRPGMFDPPERVPCLQVPEPAIDSPQDRAPALPAAPESGVRTTNDNGPRPLSKNLKIIAIVGPLAASAEALLASYYGLNPRLVTIVLGIVEMVTPGTLVLHQRGCELKNLPAQAGEENRFPHVGFSPMDADVIIACIGLVAKIEGEEGDVCFSGRNVNPRRIDFPEVWQAFLQYLKKHGIPMVSVLVSGSGVHIPWEQKNLPAII